MSSRRQRLIMTAKWCLRSQEVLRECLKKENAKFTFCLPAATKMYSLTFCYFVSRKTRGMYCSMVYVYSNQNYRPAAVYLHQPVKLQFTSVSVQTHIIYVVKTLKEFNKKVLSVFFCQNGNHLNIDTYDSCMSLHSETIFLQRSTEG